MSDPRQPALLLSSLDDTEVAIISELLASHGIPHSTSPPVRNIQAGPLREMRIYVASESLDEARRVIAAYRDNAPEGGLPTGQGYGVVLTMTHTVQAATRIDLAGGTLDIWPIYLFLDKPVTVNVAIDLHAELEAAPLRDQRVELVSEDLHLKQEAADPHGLALDGALPLPARLVRSFMPAGGVRLRSRASVPAGSGLGGSSALAAGAAVALNRLAGSPPIGDVHALARRLANLEAQVLGIPTGVQDYYPALLGGVLELEFAAEGVTARRLPVNQHALVQRLVLVYEGASRSSGLSNLDMLRRYLEDQGDTREAMAAVARAAADMARALATGDMDAAGRAMNDEMTARERLSPTVLTPATRRLFAAARQAGALGAKVCGAGGGGCSVYWACADGWESLVTALEAAGGQVLPFQVATQGLLDPVPPR